MFKNILAGLALALCGQAAISAPVALTWQTTLNPQSLVPGQVVGEVITTTLTVDNGGTSTASQTWSGANFLSYRVEGASGWWATSSVLTDIYGSFTTDASGVVTSVGNWSGGFFSNGAVTTSWAGAGTGGWWNNGANEVFCLSGAITCVFADNVTGNQLAANWKAGPAVSAVPVPATLPLLLAGVGGFAALRRKSRKA